MDKLKITFVNTGYGEAVILECPDSTFPDGRFIMLIDGGSGDSSEFTGNRTGRIRLSEYLRKNPLPHIDIMVCTHIHEDHVSGLKDVLPRPEVMWQNYEPEFYRQIEGMTELHDTLSLSKFTQSIGDYCSLCRSILENGGKITEMKAGSGEIRLCEGLSVEIPAPSDEAMEERLNLWHNAEKAEGTDAYREAMAKLDVSLNNSSLVLKFHYGETEILLPGDTNEKGFRLIEGDIRADLFKIGHHGQKDAASPELIERIVPAHVVCCASSDRRYLSADPAVMDMIRQHGAKLWFSDCPEGQNVPPHNALEFLADRKKNITGRYLSV
jgi:beta-lactamase superfamily II metal-dependent hydrolase